MNSEIKNFAILFLIFLIFIIYYKPVQANKVNMNQQTQTFLKVSIPIQEISNLNDNFFSIIAKGKLNHVEVGLKLLISKSFQPIFGIKNGDIAEVHDALEAQVSSGLILWGGENILNNLINQIAQEWDLPACPVTNDLNCDGQLLWGDIGALKPYKALQEGRVCIEPADIMNLLTKDTPLNLLRFKALGFYVIKSKEGPSAEDEVHQVPFFINIDLNKMLLEIEEKDMDARKEFINLFCLDESHQEERLKNKNKVMLILKYFTDAN